LFSYEFLLDLFILGTYQTIAFNVILSELSEPALTLKNRCVRFYKFFVEYVLLSLFVYLFILMQVTMPSIVSQTQLDSPRITAPSHSEYNQSDIPADNPVVLEDMPLLPDPLVAVEQICDDKPSPAPWSFLSWKTSIKKPMSKPVPVASFFRNAKGSSVGKVSGCCTTASLKKRVKIVDTPCDCAGIPDPASTILAKRLHHQYLMELHDRFKKNRMVGTVASFDNPPAMLGDKSAMLDGESPPLAAMLDGESPPLAKQQKMMHGLAPRGMSIPKKGMAYVMRVDHTVKEPVKESNQEMYNRFKHEEEGDKKKKDKKEVKKLKEEGKVCTLAPYMYS
jgi:hypothetical protein